MSTPVTELHQRQIAEMTAALKEAEEFAAKARPALEAAEQTLTDLTAAEQQMLARLAEKRAEIAQATVKRNDLAGDLATAMADAEAARKLLAGMTAEGERAVRLLATPTGPLPLVGYTDGHPAVPLAVWDASTPPGGVICAYPAKHPHTGRVMTVEPHGTWRLCAMPIESEPCPLHGTEAPEGSCLTAVDADPHALPSREYANEAARALLDGGVVSPLGEPVAGQANTPTAPDGVPVEAPQEVPPPPSGGPFPAVGSEVADVPGSGPAGEGGVTAPEGGADR
jgi:hypothetical protein